MLKAATIMRGKVCMHELNDHDMHVLVARSSSCCDPLISCMNEIGTAWTATSHIVAAVVGSGVLALAWTVAQLGWVVGPLVLVGFSCVTYYTSALLADCYRYPDPVHGAVNREYIDAVRCYLGILYF
jgi:fatty acid desaturase